MNKVEIQRAINTLIMVSGDCPYERGIGKEKDFNCEGNNCVDCWKIALFNELTKIKTLDKTTDTNKNYSIITGKDAKRILDECKIPQSKESKENGEKLIKYFNKFTNKK